MTESKALESGFFRHEREGGVAHLVMNRPDKANAMSPEFWEDLPRLVKALGKDQTVRALVISAEGRHFTAGMDLASFEGVLGFASEEPARGAFALRDLILKLQGAFTALEQARFPVLCAIHGACYGGGIDMITAADIRLSTVDAVFAIEEINIGMAADVGTLQRLPKIIPPGVARELCYTGRKFSGADAKGWGLVNETYPDRETVVAAALDLARAIAARSPVAVAGVKRALTYARDHSVEDGLDQIAAWNAGMLRPEDLMEAMRARKEKQAGTFRDFLEEKG